MTPLRRSHPQIKKEKEQIRPEAKTCEFSCWVPAGHMGPRNSLGPLAPLRHEAYFSAAEKHSSVEHRVHCEIGKQHPEIFLLSDSVLLWEMGLWLWGGGPQGTTQGPHMPSPLPQFNRCITSQLIKWFSNFREFYYIQMEKYARQAINDGVTSTEDLSITRDCELYRALNMHYNKANDFEVSDTIASSLIPWVF